MRTRIKFCGITRPEDGIAAAAAGADAIGLVFYRDSPRYIAPTEAAAVCVALPPFISRVALFVDPDVDWVREVLRTAPADLLQFHGAEPEDFCASFKRPYIKAVRVQEVADVLQADRAYGSARALLLDAFVPGKPGGTGSSIPWANIPTGLSHAIILAGGLNPENVSAAIAAVRPYAVDVSGGIEIRPGIKDPGKMLRFAAAVNQAGS